MNNRKYFVKKLYILVLGLFLFSGCVAPMVQNPPDLGYFYCPSKPNSFYGKIQPILSSSTTIYKESINYNGGYSYTATNILNNETAQFEFFEPFSIGVLIPAFLTNESNELAFFSLFPYIKYSHVLNKGYYINCLSAYSSFGPSIYHAGKLPFSFGLNISRINRQTKNAYGLSLSYSDYFLSLDVPYRDREGYKTGGDGWANTWDSRQFLINNREIKLSIYKQFGILFFNLSPAIVVNSESKLGSIVDSSSTAIPINYGFKYYSSLTFSVGLDFSRISKNY